MTTTLQYNKQFKVLGWLSILMGSAAVLDASLSAQHLTAIIMAIIGITLGVLARSKGSSSMFIPWIGITLSGLLLVPLLLFFLESRLLRP